MKFLTFLKLLLIFLVINSCNSQAQEINDGAKIFTKFPLERKVKSKDFKSLKNYSVLYPYQFHPLFCCSRCN